MPVSDKRHMRVVVLIALFLVAGIALRGYFPGDEPVPDKKAADQTASLIAVVLVLATALAIIAVAVIASLRNPHRPTGSGFGPLARGSGEKWRPNWRRILLVVGVILVWLLAVIVLLRLVAPDLDGTTSSAEPSMSESGDRSGTPTRSAEPEEEPPDESGDVFGYLAAASVVLMVLLVIGGVGAFRRQRLAQRGQPLLEDGALLPDENLADPLALAAEVGLEKVGDRSREPREAIIACYAAMERALAESPGVVPQDSDTPTEVLARAVGQHAIRAESATELVNLFAEARFSPHVMTEAHRAAAERALRLVLADLRSVV